MKAAILALALAYSAPATATTYVTYTLTMQPKYSYLPGNAYIVPNDAMEIWTIKMSSDSDTVSYRSVCTMGTNCGHASYLEYTVTRSDAGLSIFFDGYDYPLTTYSEAGKVAVTPVGWIDGIQDFEDDNLSAPPYSSLHNQSFDITFTPMSITSSFTDAPMTLGFSRKLIPYVPEPATWAMMIGGFGMIGAALRRRKTSLGVG